MTHFLHTLSTHNKTLQRDQTTTLQVGVGLKCNQTCVHCHQEAGPLRTELMSKETMDDVINLASCGDFKTIDITGGAPELNPDLCYFIENLSRYCSRIMLRSNLTALFLMGDELANFLKDQGVVLICSFPSLNMNQFEAQRGNSTFQLCIEYLKRLNHLGYGKQETDLELNLAVNPSGAFLIPSQAAQEKRFKRALLEKWDIYFNNLFAFSNMPLGRFRTWLNQTNNYEKYLNELKNSFNPDTVQGLMCRTTLSISWDGYLFDCDFNQATNLFMANKKTHVSTINAPPEPESPIAVGDHCYVCTAGDGFT